MMTVEKKRFDNLGRVDKEKTFVLGPSKFDPKVIARHHREMFHLHDLKEWSSLEENAREMIIALGYDEEDAKKASVFVVRAYQNANLAVEAQRKGDVDEEIASYNSVLDNFKLASISVGSDTSGLKYKIGWYRSDRHNNTILVAYYLFREHLKRFGVLHFGTVIFTTWIAFWGGYFAHKKHDWEKLESVMVKYWKCIYRIYPTRPPLQI
jgi:hypothetical protein